MAYERTNWQNGDVISSEKLNKMEAGIEYACSLEHEVDEPTDGQVLKYDAEKGKFVNEDAPAAIETNIQNPTDGQTLKYDAESGKWVNGEGGGTALIVDSTAEGQTNVLNKTYKEIKDAIISGKTVYIRTVGDNGADYSCVIGISYNTDPLEGTYELYDGAGLNYVAESENDYPVMQE